MGPSRAEAVTCTSVNAASSKPEVHLPKDATQHTEAVLAGFAIDHDPADMERATRGLIAQHRSGRIERDGALVWDTARHDFVREQTMAPPTVNPSLWHHAQLDAVHGLFEVVPGVWQARGYDIANITFIAGETGWILVDVLSTDATARACLELANEHLGERPVVGVIYTHSHADHFGGVLGVTTLDDVEAGRCVIVAPEGFLHEAVAENVIGGTVMGRRAAYQFGPLLAPGPKGHVDAGLGTGVPFGMAGLIAPTHNITTTGETMTIDGVQIIFQMTPEAEAPAEMNFFFPKQGWLCMAENCSHTMHNLVPIRGAQVRNALAWSKYINDAIDMFGADTTVMFTSHHWPRWGRDDVGQFLEYQRDLYRWMHDQTMRFANLGLTPLEIAEHLKLPAEFEGQSHTRGYYGSLVHNVKAVYQRYLSWYDGNPARLHPHPPTEAGKRYVEFMGGADAVIAKARQSFDLGDYRWVAEVVNHVVFADPSNTAARHLQADALEQLGYQAESATFRNAYLTGAQELRSGPPPARQGMGPGLLPALSVELLFDYLAVRLRAEDVGGRQVTLNVCVSDVGENWVLGLQHRALHASRNRTERTADATVTLSRMTLIALAMKRVSLSDAMKSGAATVVGNAEAFALILDHLDTFMSGFNIVEP
jgi:alkyl sulfatase BDS1-like metallo-beta-lactamase superfamily hydrolase